MNSIMFTSTIHTWITFFHIASIKIQIKYWKDWLYEYMIAPRIWNKLNSYKKDHINIHIIKYYLYVTLYSIYNSNSQGFPIEK